MNEALLAIIRATLTDKALADALISKLNEAKLSVRTAAEEEQFKTNLTASINKEELIKEEKKIWMRRIEDDVRELTGLKQNPSEPYHEFMKRGFKALQDKVAEIETEKRKLEEKGGDGDGVWKTKYETLERQSKEALAAKDQLLADLNKKTEMNDRRIELDKVFNPIAAKFVDQLPSYFNDYKDSVVQDVLKHSAMIDGKLVLVDEKGNPRKDNNLNNISVESYLSDKFKEVIKTDKQQPGSGATPPGGNNNPPAAGAGKFNVSSLPAEVTTQSLLTEYLGKQGLLQGSKEFDEAFAEAVKEKNITKIF